ncbi:selenium cofactor biosynthesis protein YqeC [Thermovenabulum sp.]|uniref:selenium cofactor biosynthesis protein YqeC n=1 Tax=Thermovenabulum sp. TaxID=3100335 RepID=UPI003C7EB9DE
MILTEILELKEKEMISAVGGGGKTTLLFNLALELSKVGKKVLLSTTTKIYLPESEENFKVILGDEEEVLNSIKAEKNLIIISGKRIVEENKLEGLNKSFYNIIFEKNMFDYILIEADGSKRKPIKFHAYYEPVIPELTTKVIGIVGLDCMGEKLDNQIFHRAEDFSREFGYKIGDNIDEKMVADLIISGKGLFKTSPDDSEKILILNKADNPDRQNWATKIIKEIKKRSDNLSLAKILITSFEKNILMTDNGG